MPIKGDQRTAYNDALKEVTATNKELAKLYQSKLDDITKELAALKLQIDQGRFSDALASKQVRLQKLYDLIEEQVKELYRLQGVIMTSGYVDTFKSSYYQIGFAIEKEVNNVLLEEATYSYSLNYPQISNAYARSQLNILIGGYTFKERQGIDRLIMQGQLRDIINNATRDGLTPQQVAKELQKIDDVFTKNRNKAITTARTELLRAYSIATEESGLIALDRGVDIDKIWDATLDGRTRPAHAKADQQKADENGFFRVGSERTLGPRMPGLSAGNSINCRCRAVFIPVDVKPNTRGFRSTDPDEKWKQTNADMTWEEWSKTLEGVASIEAANIAKRERAKRLRK